MSRIGPFIGASEFFGQQSTKYKDLHVLASRLDYNRDNVLILRGDVEKLKSEYPDTYANMMSCIHNSDSRTPLEYAQDIVASWLFEDFLVAKVTELDRMLNEDFALNLSGADKGRELLQSSDVSSKADCVFTYKNKSVPVEVMTDYTGFWTKSKKLDLRDEKYPSLCKEKSILLGISTKDTKYLLLDFTNETKIPKAEQKYHPIWHKPAYTIMLNDAGIKMDEFAVFNIVEKLKEILDAQ